MAKRADCVLPSWTCIDILDLGSSSEILVAGAIGLIQCRGGQTRAGIHCVGVTRDGFIVACRKTGTRLVQKLRL